MSDKPKRKPRRCSGCVVMASELDRALEGLRRIAHGQDEDPRDVAFWVVADILMDREITTERWEEFERAATEVQDQIPTAADYAAIRAKVGVSGLATFPAEKL